jgi:outer membrane lipoprotein-sorting protein
VEAILKQLEAAAGKFPALVADMQYHAKLTQLGDVEERQGKVYWLAGTKAEPPKFRIHFDTLKQGDDPKARTIKNVEDFVFDGEWFTVRKERTKQMTREQVAAPGEKVTALELGKGPFLVPFGQKADDVARIYVVTTRPLKEGEPANTDYLKLVARPGQKVDIVWAELWVDKTTGLPVKIVAQDKSENVTTVIFKNIQTPGTLPKDTFNLPVPARADGWEFNVNPFKTDK